MKFIYGLALGRVLLTLPNMNVWHDTMYFLLCWNNYLSVRNYSAHPAIS